MSNHPSSRNKYFFLNKLFFKYPCLINFTLQNNENLFTSNKNSRKVVEEKVVVVEKIQDTQNRKTNSQKKHTRQNKTSTNVVDIIFHLY
jgi:hypothetical protein